MRDPLFLLTEEEYAMLLGTGLLWELYPEATGDYSIDSQEPPHAS